jgi:hypothetical protein
MPASVPLDFSCNYSKQMANEIKIFSEDVKGKELFDYEDLESECLVSYWLCIFHLMNLTFGFYFIPFSLCSCLGNLAIEGLVNIKVDCVAKDSALLGHEFIDCYSDTIFFVCLFVYDMTIFILTF